jgi:lipid A 4'-phosphatase
MPAGPTGPAWAACHGTGGLVTGLVRMAQGGHFLSEVAFAGVFMALTVLALRALMLRGGVSSPAPRQGAPDPPP